MHPHHYFSKWAKPSLYIFSFFSQREDKDRTILTINDKSVDGVLLDLNPGSRMEVEDMSTELHMVALDQHHRYNSLKLQIPCL